MKLSFHGGVRGVTGSCFLLETDSVKLLIDCGMFQGERMCGGKNFEEFGFNPEEIDAVFVTHAHFDHTGRLPLLMKRGYKGPIYMTPPTKALSRIILEDALTVMHENAHECGDMVLYDEPDLKAMLAACQGVNYHTQFHPSPDVSVMFHDAGHILGSGFLTIDAEGKRIVFSGDVGNENVPILPATEEIERADVIVSESTYGNRDHEPAEGRKRSLVEMTTKILNRGGTLLIPAFSIERTQELLYELDELADEGLIPDVPIYLDSPLAIRATEIYREYKHYLRFDRPVESSRDKDFFSFRNLHETLTRDASKRINDDQKAKIIIAGSGMMTGGRILHHLKRYLDDPKSGVLIIGYQAEGTLGRRIQNKEETVTIYNDKIDVKAEVKKLSSFSAHADRTRMAQWLNPKEGPAERIFLVHGDPTVKSEFKEFLKDKVNSTVIIPEFQQEFDI